MFSSDIEIVTRDIYSNAPVTTWTSRAGAFLEESKAFIDKYLTKKELPESASADVLESSGATSNDDVWETPTSGGEYDDAHTFIASGCSQQVLFQN